MLTHTLHQGRCLTSGAPTQQRDTARLSDRSRRVVRPRALFGGKKDGEGGGGNPFGNMGNLLENMKKAQQLVQVEAARVQEELASTDFEGYSDDETVRVVMSGNQEPRSIDFTEEALDGGSDKLSELTLQAMKDAHRKSVQGMKDRMGELAGKLGIPQNAGANPFGM